MNTSQQIEKQNHDSLQDQQFITDWPKIHHGTVIGREFEFDHLQAANSKFVEIFQPEKICVGCGE